MSLGPTQEEREAIEAELRSHGTSSTMRGVRARMMRERASLLTALGNAGMPPERRELLSTLLSDNRNSMETLATDGRAVLDAEHAQVIERSAALSNQIAQTTEAQARSLTRATWILAAATVVLAIATIFLIYVTATSGE